jgi:hypothetical protein
MQEVSMNAIASEPGTSSPSMSGLRRRSLAVGALATAVTVAAVLFAVLKSPHPDSSQTSTLPYVAGAVVLAGIVVFGWLVPMRMAARGTGLPFAIVSVPFVAAYWSGLSIVIAAGAILVALTHRADAGQKRGRALAAVILGALVLVVTLGAIVVG